jgi:hypothetical protein
MMVTLSGDRMTAVMDGVPVLTLIGPIAREAYELTGKHSNLVIQHYDYAASAYKQAIKKHQ